MVDLIVKLLDYVVKLGNLRESNRREYFDRYIQPAYETAELIYNDYCELLTELRETIEQSDTSEPVIRMLQSRRRELLAPRARLRALIAERVREGRATRFEAGILGLMSGVVTSVDRPYVQLYAYADGGLVPQLGRHTVLDILQKLEQRKGDFSGARGEVLVTVDEKAQGIEEAWQTVVAGYAELHTGTLPPAGVHVRPERRRLAKIAEVQSLLAEITAMADSGQYGRKTAIGFEEAVADVLPELHPLAQELRETVHDLDNEEPNVTVAELEHAVLRFEQELDRVLGS